jgi:hypothetical protein
MVIDASFLDGPSYHAASQAAARRDGVQEGAAHRDPGAQARVGQMRRGQRREPPLKFWVIYT